MGIINAPNIVRDGLVLAVDAANVRSFRGEPTTNYSRNVRNFSETAYASSDEWSSDPTRLTKSYISTIQTPIGNGATLIYESGTAGYHHLSRYGGGDESGTHSISCYVRPVTADITEFMIGMLGDGGNSVYFNLNTLAISYGGGISNRNAFIETVPGYPGWYRVGANIEGRVGGWVGSVGYSIHTSYTGTLGNKRCYITGIQYEFTSKPTQFLEAEATRGTTNATGGGWVDLSGNGNHGQLVNGPTYDSANGGSLVFDGTNDYISIANNTALDTQTPSVEVWVRTNATSQNGFWFEKGAVNTQYSLFQEGSNIVWRHTTNVVSLTASGPTHLSTAAWAQVVGTYTSGDRRIYVNGVQVASDSLAYTIPTNSSGIRIGSYLDGGYFYNGRIAIVRVYTKNLSSTEVLRNFEATRARFGV